MIEMIPRSWVSWHFDLLKDGERIAEIHPAMLKEEAHVEIEGVLCRFYREKLFSGLFVMEAGGKRLVEAKKPSTFKKQFDIDIGGKTYVLRAVSWTRRRYLIESEGETVGSITPKNWVSRQATIEMTEQLPTGVVVFFAWLVVVMWKRDASAGAGS